MRMGFRIMAGLVLLLSGVTTGAAFEGDCLLEVDGKAYLDGPCNVEIEADGSFTIGVGETSGSDHFAYVVLEPDARGLASATWNGVEAAGRAHDQLGTLNRRGACWENDRAKVCAWRTGTRPPAHQQVMIHGRVITGTLDSAVGNYRFLKQSPEADRIFEACKGDHECEVQARVKDGVIIEVLSATSPTGTTNSARAQSPSFVQVLTYVTLHSSTRQQAVLDRMSEEASLETMVRDGLIKTVYDCLPEHRPTCFDVLSQMNTGGDGETIIHEWSEWMDALDEAEKSAFASNLLTQSLRRGFNLFSNDELAQSLSQ